METLSNSEWPTLSQVKEEKACNVSSEENKKCDVCSYATTKMSNLKRHMKLHSKVKSEHVGPLWQLETIVQKAVPGHPLFIFS